MLFLIKLIILLCVSLQIKIIGHCQLCSLNLIKFITKVFSFVVIIFSTLSITIAFLLFVVLFKNVVFVQLVKLSHAFVV